MTPDSPLTAAARARIKAAIEEVRPARTIHVGPDSEELIHGIDHALDALAERLGIDL